MITLRPTLTIERYFNSAWDDITDQLASGVTFDLGMSSDDYADRLAKVGRFAFDVLAASFNSLTDFPQRMKIRIKLDAGHSVIKTFICYVSDVKPSYNLYDENSKTIRIAATCYFGLSSLDLLRAIEVDTDQRIDQAVTTLLTHVPIQPTGTDFDTGTQTFPYVFDIVRTGKTTLYSELAHLIMSELGQCYMTCGDVLTIENYNYRNTYQALPTYTYTYPTEDGAALLHQRIWEWLDNNDTWSISSGSAVNNPGAPDAEDFCVIQGGVVDVKIRANVTAGTGVVGVAGWLDDIANPLNCLRASISAAGSIGLLRIANGTPGVLIAESVNYAAGAPIEIRGHISGGDLLVSLYYNGVQVGTEKTVSNAGIISNTYHGMYSTASDGSISRFDLLNYSDDSEIFSDLFERVTLSPVATTGFLRLMSGGKILLNHTSSGTFNSTFTRVMDAEVVQGKNIVNEVSFTVNPRKVDLGVGAYEQLHTYNLYSVNPPIPIANGGTITLRGGYWDEYPSHKSRIDAAMDVQEPTVGGAVSSFVLDPVGTANMTFAWTGGGDSWEWTVGNASGTLKNITYMEFYGRPISNQQPLEYALEGTASQSVYGKNSIQISQPYKDELDLALVEAAALLELESDPRVQVKSIDLCANTSEADMLGFIYTDIGSLRRVTLANPDKDALYYVQGIRGSVAPGGVINYTLTLKEKRRAVGQRTLTVQTTPNNGYYGVAWSPELELFAAIGTSNGTTTHVMTSPDGITWTAQTTDDLDLYAICWSPELGLFCAVGDAGAVITSPDGETWTTQTAASTNNWRSVAWSPSLGLFAAVSITGTGNRVMTSPDGVNWTSQTSAADNDWRGVAWSPSLGMFAAVSDSGSLNRAMTSTNGTAWTSQTTTDRAFAEVVWSVEQAKFVAIAASYSATSTNGTTWTEHSHGVNLAFSGLAFSPSLGLYLACSASSDYRLLYSTDGETWTALASPAAHAWSSICWSPPLGVFVIVGYNGTSANAMTF